jgi:flagellar FliL protein
MLLIGSGLLVVVIAAGVGSYFAFKSKPHTAHNKAAPAAAASADTAAEADANADNGDAKEKKLPAQYLEMQPSFVVNLEDDQTSRYLQVDVQLMTRDPKAADEIKANMPRLRNTLMMLFSQQHSKDLNTREGKEALQKQALDQVQAVMRDETGSPAIEALYFTNLVMQ